MTLPQAIVITVLLIDVALLLYQQYTIWQDKRDA